MATTRYNVIANDTVTEVFVKKAKALEFAQALRDSDKIGVVVVTGSGNVVLDLAAPKKIKMSPPYTRVVNVPEDVQVPEGKRVCYTKSRKGLAVLHDAETGEYSVIEAKTGKTLETFATTRECGRFTTDFKVPANA